VTATSTFETACGVGHILRTAIRALNGDGGLDEIDAFAVAETLHKADAELIQVTAELEGTSKVAPQIEYSGQESSPDLPTLDNWNHTASAIAQIANLTRTLQHVLKEECNAPLQDHQPGALAIAIERATDDALALFEAYYYPRRIEGET